MHPLITLNNGLTMPQIGLGVWQAKDGQEVEQAVKTAIECGYRSIDTAAIYGNERGVGRAIAESGIPREELFLTTKVWNADQGYDQTLKAFDKSIKRLGVEYIDLYLIHWPVPAKDLYAETWSALEKLYADGKVRSIGVSNFTIDYLKRLMRESSIIPAVNQVELHPHLSQIELRKFCTQHGIAVESYSPLGGTGGKLLTEPALKDIGDTRSKTPAQIVIRWHIQNNLIVIPKSVTPQRIKENIDVFDFELTNDEMTTINNLNVNARVGSDPTTANFT